MQPPTTRRMRLPVSGPMAGLNLGRSRVAVHCGLGGRSDYGKHALDEPQRRRGEGIMPGKPKIRVLLADVDGTLVTPQKELTEEALAAARELQAADITLSITSGRPPRGMAMLIEPLALTGPVAGFHGGVFVNPDLSV